MEIIDRSSVNAFDDVRVARAIAATSRKKLIFASISLKKSAGGISSHDGREHGARRRISRSTLRGLFSETKRQVGLLHCFRPALFSTGLCRR